MSKKILILGASRYYSKSIEAARLAGYYVIAVDRNEQSEGFSAADAFAVCDIIDREGILKVAQSYGIDGIVPVNDYGVPTAAFVASKLGLPGISEQSALWATSKIEMRKRWSETGVPCPQFRIATTVEEIKNAVEQVGLPCILKPGNGIGGASRGVVVVRNMSELERAISFSQQFYNDKTTLVETFVDAEYEHSAEVIIHSGVPHVIAISDKIKTPLPYRVDKNVLYPTALSGERLKELKHQICRAVLALDIHVGAAHVEAATTKEGCILFELGARCGGGGTPEPIVHFSTGINEFVETVRVLVGDPPENLVPSRDFGCNYHFITPPPGRVKTIEGLEAAKSLVGVLDAELFMKPGDEIPFVTVGGQRAGFIITGAPSREEAYAVGCKAEALIEFAYEN